MTGERDPFVPQDSKRGGRLQMFSAQHERWVNARKTLVSADGEPLAYARVAELWRDDEAFRVFFIDLLREAPFGAYRWETPPVTAGTFDRAFEFVLLDCPSLARAVDRSAFAEHFVDDSAGAGSATETRDGGDANSVVSFANLGGDAVLIVPCPRGPDAAYGHLAAFTRGAPTAQQHALWRTIGERLIARVGERPVWLSTAGMGVAWLHVRLDDRPKYYGHTPYREPPRP